MCLCCSFACEASTMPESLGTQIAEVPSYNAHHQIPAGSRRLYQKERLDSRSSHKALSNA